MFSNHISLPTLGFLPGTLASTGFYVPEGSGALYNSVVWLPVLLSRIILFLQVLFHKQMLLLNQRLFGRDSWILDELLALK